jgi:AraC family transcriptional regulator, positive regulator of tynA and feaB
MNRHWSTNDAPARQEFAYWREAVCEAVMNVATEDLPEQDFSGDILCINYGELRFASFKSTAHRIVRRPFHIGRSSHAHYLVSLQRSGIGRLEQAGNTCKLQAGDIGIVDGERPFTVTFPQAVDRAVAVIPSEMLLSRAPWLRERPINSMTHDRDLLPMLRTTIERLSGRDCQSGSEAELLTDNLCNLVAILTAPDNTKLKALQARLSDLDRMLLFVRRHLANPKLSPLDLANHLQVSVRTVHKRFEAAETSFGHALLELRLDATRRVLSDPKCERLTITQIAFAAGFNDLSHFTNTFRKKFGMPPGRYRTHTRTVSAGSA